ncbi:MAG: iron-containing alcohol dehydrogenase [Planctomycetes bacterium]|nr:iron-containing alcohol dehydrogenase [Planctomycetota bacterium]
MRTTWNFFTAGQLVFGRAAVRQLGDLVARRKASRLFVATDATLVQVGIADKVTDALRDAKIQFEVFDGGEPEPSINAAMQAIEQARQFRPDAILGLGGGSNMDLAKYVAVAVTHGGSPQDYFGVENLPGPVMPLICVPTTSGTGSEVSHAAVLTDTDNQMKVSMLSNHLRPDLAIVDPELTVTCPKKVTADSGIDALTHAIEATTAVDFDKMKVPTGEASAYEGRYPLGDCLAEKAIQLIGQHLRIAVNEPDNLVAREGMSLAATLAGLAFSNCGVALVHALEYPLGGALHCSHGAGNGLLLPFVMRFNLPERTKTFARIATLLGEDVAGLDQSSAAERAITAVEKLRGDIGIPQSIREIGGTEDQLPTFAEKAFALKRLQWVNPRESTLRDFEDILKAAF